MRRRRCGAVVGAGRVLAALIWEGYKAVGNPDGTVLLGVRVLPRADDAAMPHVLRRSCAGSADPELAGGRPVWQVVLDACLFTLGITAVGLRRPARSSGCCWRSLMQRFRIVERGLLPYVILSQTVPLVALAPLIAGWGGELSHRARTRGSRGCRSP